MAKFCNHSSKELCYLFPHYGGPFYQLNVFESIYNTASVTYQILGIIAKLKFLFKTVP